MIWNRRRNISVWLKRSVILAFGYKSRRVFYTSDFLVNVVGFIARVPSSAFPLADYLAIYSHDFC